MAKHPLATALWSQNRDTTAIRKAEDFAKFTITSLMADPLLQTGPNAQVLEYDFQSLGALLVNNLTAKLVMILFPPGRPAFRIEVSEEILQAAKAKGIDEAEITNKAAQLEQQSTKRLFVNAGLSKLHRALKLLIVTGNALIYRDTTTGKFLVWGMHNYVQRRTPTGEPSQVVLKQRMRLSEMPKELARDAIAKRAASENDESPLDLYTVIEWSGDGDARRVEVHQQIGDKRVGPISTYPAHLCPWIPAVWNLVDGEHMGRGYVEEYSGDFAKLSLISEQLGMYELESLNVLNLVDESAGGVVDDYQNADTGDYVPGKTGAVTAYERGDYNKIAAVNNGLAALATRLQMAFMYTGQMRDAERVTAAEIRQVANEAENLLGGVYSLLAETVQTPIAYLTIYEVARASGNLMLGVLNRTYKPQIVAGLPALTRAADTQNILQATQEAAAVVPALGQLSKRFDTEKIVELIFRNNSVDLDAISKSADQIAQEGQQEQAQAMAGMNAAEAAVTATDTLPTVIAQ